MQRLNAIAIAILGPVMIFGQAENKQPGNQAGNQAEKQRPAGQADARTTPTNLPGPRSFTGTVVDANCSQSSSLTSRSSSAADATDKKYKSVYDLEREVIKHCPASTASTAFAVVTDEGNFYKLDEAGNTQVKSQAGISDSGKDKKKLKNMRVTGTGTLEGDTLKVQSLTKTDKPFGPA
jgi:hypothetical protein